MTGSHLVFSTYLETKARRGQAEVVSFYRIEALNCNARREARRHMLKFVPHLGSPIVFVASALERGLERDRRSGRIPAVRSCRARINRTYRKTWETGRMAARWRRVPFAWLALLLLTCSWGNAQDKRSESISRLNKLIVDRFAATGCPGLSVTVAVNNEIVFSSALGMADVNKVCH